MSYPNEEVHCTEPSPSVSIPCSKPRSVAAALVDTGQQLLMLKTGNTKGGSIIVPLTSCLTGLESDIQKLTIFVFICKIDWSKPVKQEVNSTVILPPLVFPAEMNCSVHALTSRANYLIQVEGDKKS